MKEKIYVSTLTTSRIGSKKCLAAIPVSLSISRPMFSTIS